MLEFQFPKYQLFQNKIRFSVARDLNSKEIQQMKFLCFHYEQHIQNLQF